MDQKPGKEKVESVLKELSDANDCVFEVMQTIVDGECKNKAIDKCEKVLFHIKKLEEIVRTI